MNDDMNWMMMIILTVMGMLLIAVDFYLPGFVLGSIGAVLMLVATALCYSGTGSLNETIIVFCVEVALGIGAGGQMQQPLAIAILGGVSLSMLFSLIGVPLLYLLLARAPAATAPPHAPVGR